MADDIKKIQDILRKAEEYAAKKAAQEPKARISSGAFWVSPRGEIRVVEGGIYHINDVIHHPSVFGWSKDDVEALYDQYGEHVGQEGDARDNLMTSLLKEGWVRIRVRKNFYSIQVWEFNSPTYNRLEIFVSKAIEYGIKGQYATEYDEAKINALKTGRMKSLSFGEVLKGHLYETVEGDVDLNFFTR